VLDFCRVPQLFAIKEFFKLFYVLRSFDWSALQFLHSLRQAYCTGSVGLSSTVRTIELSLKLVLFNVVVVFNAARIEFDQVELLLLPSLEPPDVCLQRFDLLVELRDLLSGCFQLILQSEDVPGCHRRKLRIDILGFQSVHSSLGADSASATRSVAALLADRPVVVHALKLRRRHKYMRTARVCASKVRALIQHPLDDIFERSWCRGG
jgi:hypothetical protein